MTDEAGSNIAGMGMLLGALLVIIAIMTAVALFGGQTRTADARTSASPVSSTPAQAAASKTA